MRLCAALVVLVVISIAATFQPARAASASRPSRLFWVARSSGWSHLRLEEVAQSTRVRVYAPPSAHLPAWQARELVAAFDSRIFPTDVRIFGFPPRLAPVDIALVPLDSMTLGYFDQNDVNAGAPGGDPAHSNRANVLFARLPSAMPDADKLADTEEVLAHELQHLIEYRVRVLDRRLAPEETWLNEGMSFLAQIVNGYWTPRDVLKVQAACGSPSWPVTTLNQSLSFLRHNARIAYGRAGLFVTYLAGRFGPGIARDIIDTPDTGLAAVDDQVHARDPRLDVGQVFADWGVTQYLHARGRYSYGPYSPRLRPVPALAVPVVSTFPFDSRPLTSSAFTLQPWGQAYYQFFTHGGRNLEIRVDAPPGAVRVAAVVEDSTRFSPPVVRWLSARSDGSLLFRLDALANIYDRVTLVVSAEPGISAPDTQLTRLRVRSYLVNMSDNDRAGRLAASALRDPNLALRQILQLRHPVAVLPVDPESPRIPVGDA
jgi:hypothetical protein